MIKLLNATRIEKKKRETGVGTGDGGLVGEELLCSRVFALVRARQQKCVFVCVERLIRLMRHGKAGSCNIPPSIPVHLVTH